MPRMAIRLHRAVHVERSSGKDVTAAEQSPFESGRARQDAGKRELARQHLQQRDDCIIRFELGQSGGEFRCLRCGGDCLGVCCVTLRYTPALLSQLRRFT